jgi:hypothetical protein
MPFVKKRASDVEQKTVTIEQMRTEMKNAVETGLTKVIESKDKVIEENHNQLQEASNRTYSLAVTVAQIDLKGRPGDLLQQKTEQVQSVLPAPTAKVVQTELATVRKQLDTQRTTNEDLTKQHQKLLGEAEALKTRATQAENLASQASEAVVTTQTTYQKKIDSEQEQRFKLQMKNQQETDEALAKAESSKAEKARMQKIMSGVGIALIVVGLALAYFRHFIIGAVSGAIGTLFITLGYFITQIEPWVFWTAFIGIGIVAPALMWFAYRRGLFQEPPAQVGDYEVKK